MTTSSKIIELCKARAAKLAVDENIDFAIRGNRTIGIGSGSTMTYVLNRIVEICKERNVNLKCIPTSLQAEDLIHEHGLDMATVDSYHRIDVAIDGADEVDANLVAIKGGGACHLQEKLVASSAERFVVVADYRKDSVHLGTSWRKGIPIEALKICRNSVRHDLVAHLDGVSLDDIKIRYFEQQKAGPVITDMGNVVLDWKFDINKTKSYTPDDWQKIDLEMKQIRGVIETGIFAKMISVAYFGQEDGSVSKRVAH